MRLVARWGGAGVGVGGVGFESAFPAREEGAEAREGGEGGGGGGEEELVG